MKLVDIFVIISSVLAVCSAIPYIIDVIKGKTKPRIVTWGIWTFLGAISCTASLVEHQYPTAILLAAIITGNIFIVVLGWKNGHKKFNKTDIFCLIGALIGLLLWWIFNSPAIAVIATITIDAIGAIPTIEHCWQKPREETLSIYIMQFTADIFILLGTSTWLITSYAYPVYATIINLLFASIIIHQRRKKKH